MIHYFLTERHTPRVMRLLLGPGLSSRRRRRDADVASACSGAGSSPRGQVMEMQDECIKIAAQELTCPKVEIKARQSWVMRWMGMGGSFLTFWSPQLGSTCHTAVELFFPGLHSCPSVGVGHPASALLSSQLCKNPGTE